MTVGKGRGQRLLTKGEVVGGWEKETEQRGGGEGKKYRGQIGWQLPQVPCGFPLVISI